MSEQIKIKKSTLYLFGIIIFVAFLSYIILRGGNSPTNDVVAAKIEGEYQKIVLGIKDFNYYPNTISVQNNMPVRVYLDSSVQGCFRSFTIKDFGIAKNLPTPNDYVEFTPTKKGTYGFACGMGMGTGKLIVE